MEDYHDIVYFYFGIRYQYSKDGNEEKKNVQLNLFFKEQCYFFETFKGSKYSSPKEWDEVLDNFSLIYQHIVRYKSHCGCSAWCF